MARSELLLLAVSRRRYRPDFELICEELREQFSARIKGQLAEIIEKANIRAALVGRNHVCQHQGMLMFWAAGNRVEAAIGPINANISISGLNIGYTFEL